MCLFKGVVAKAGSGGVRPSMGNTIEEKKKVVKLKEKNVKKKRNC